MSDELQVTNYCPICVELTAKLEAAEAKNKQHVRDKAHLHATIENKDFEITDLKSYLAEANMYCGI